MLRKNRLSPFSYSLLAVSITGILFVVFGFNGWGPSAENEQAIGEISRWCERVSGGFSFPSEKKSVRQEAYNNFVFTYNRMAYGGRFMLIRNLKTKQYSGLNAL